MKLRFSTINIIVSVKLVFLVHIRDKFLKKIKKLSEFLLINCFFYSTLNFENVLQQK